jgi:hypothetical protein
MAQGKNAMRIVKKIRGIKPLLYVGDRLIIAKGTTLYWATLDLKNFEKIMQLPSTFWKSLAGRNRFLSRILRLPIGPAIQIGDRLEILIWSLGRAYRVDLQTGTFDVENVSPQGRAPLSMIYNADLEFFPVGVYFGEYFSNRAKRPAWIWHRSDQGEWTRVFEYGQDEINHIHAVVADPIGKSLVVLTGDYDHAPRIWTIAPGFKQATPIVVPEQNSRACWILPENDNLVYATDTHLEANSVRYINRADFDETQKSNKMCDTIGSSIYAMTTTDGQTYFSTAVEPDEPTGSKFKDIFTRRWGPGIDGPQCAIYRGNSKDGFSLVYKKNTDGLPLRLFGFSAFSFPHGVAPSGGAIHCHASGIKGADGCTLLLENE